MTSVLTADALAELKRLDAAVTAAQGFIGSAEAGLEFGAALRKAFPALLSELEQSRVERKEMMEALESAIMIADEARDEWDKAQAGMRAGKILIALSGLLPRYRADIDAIHATLSRARQRTQTGG